MGFKNLLSVARLQLKIVFPFSIMPAIILLAVSPLFISLKNLNEVSAAIALERFYSLIGILLLTPLPQPEQNTGIVEIVASKKTAHIKVLMLRFMLILLILSLFMFFICSAMRLENSTFNFGYYFFGSFTTAFILGTLGFVGCLLSNNWVVGYFLPIAYYAFNIGIGPRLKMFYIFSMASQRMNEKVFLFFVAVILMIAGFVFYFLKNKHMMSNANS